MEKSKEKSIVSNNSAHANTNVDVPTKEDSTKSFDNVVLLNKAKQNLSLSVSNLETDSNAESQCATPKTETQSPSEVRRWASVVKAKKKLLLSSEFGSRQDSVDITPEIFDCVFKTFPTNVESHKGFITCNQSVFYCSVCCIELESVLSLSNHLKTRIHEDNVIIFLKQKLPQNLHYILEFVSFYGSNLCCNLCRCKIDMSSYNPFETIVNIMAHNNASDHANHKTRETENEAHNLIKSLSANFPEIKENLCFIEKKMSPQYKCQLCEKNILYHENLSTVTENFLCHLKSTCHLRNQRAVEILKQFGEESVASQDNFTVVNGNISCIHCKQYVETNVERLISHVNGVEHTKNILGKVNLSPSIVEYSELKLIQEEHIENGEVTEAITKSEKTEKNDCSNRTNVQKSKILKSLKNMDQIRYLIENEKGSITCLLCNRIIPPSVQNIRTHLLGVNHKNNETPVTGMMEEKHAKDKPCDTTKQRDPVQRNVESIVPVTLLNEKTKFKKVPEELGKISKSVVKSNANEPNCLICRTYPSRKHAQYITFLLSCPEKSSKDANLNLKNNNKNKISKCLSKEVLSSSMQDDIYNQILEKNSLVAENKSVLETNVDGIHMYCKLCRALIQFSVDSNVFESNVVQHLQGKIHMTNFSNQKLGSIKSIEDSSSSNTSINVTDSINNKENTKSEGQIITDDISKPEEKQCNHSFSPAYRMNSSLLENEDTIQKDVNASSLKTQKKKLLPITAQNMVINVTVKPVGNRPLSVKNCLMGYKEENDENVLKRREKQILYGKNTLGYSNYCKKVPKQKRRPKHPETPPKYMKCSRRTWDGMVKMWRKQLHNWDPPTETNKSLEKDIQPLASLTIN